MQVKKLEQDFIATVKATRKIALLKKEEMKIKKSLKVLKQMDVCKDHGGPLSPNSLYLLDNLSEKQLIAEVVYLRLTIAPNIRQMRRIKVDGKYKMEKFKADELKTSIRNAIQPVDNVERDVDTLLNGAL